MPELAFIPLDDRPCCWQFPLRLAEIGGADLRLPPKELWQGADKRVSDGFNKCAGGLARWLKRRFSASLTGKGNDECEALLGSWDMLSCGGLVASRCPGPKRPAGAAAKFWPLIRRLRAYMFTTVMRAAPTQRTAEEVEAAQRLVECSCSLGRRLAEEEPAGDILAFYKDSKLSGCREIRSFGVDSGFWQRYCEYRRRKHHLNSCIVRAWSRAVTDSAAKGGGRGYLAVGLDDTKTAGLNILEAGELRRLLPGPGSASIGAGTDETACLLLARAIAAGSRIKVVWPYRGAEETVTLYEGSSLGEVLRAQAQWASAVISGEVYADESLPEPDKDAAAELWIYAPWGRQQEAVRQREYSSDLPAEKMSIWLEALAASLRKGHKAFIADLAYANGGSLRLFEALKERGLWPEISGCAAWNTAGNALGTALAWASVYREGSGLLNKRFLAERLLDDLYYQSVLRPRLSAEFGGAFVFVSKERLKETEAALRAQMKAFLISEIMPLLGLSGRPFRLRVSLPWGRLFEAEVDLSFKD